MMPTMRCQCYCGNNQRLVRYQLACPHACCPVSSCHCCNRFSRASGRQLLQYLEDTCVRTASQECSSSVQGSLSMCKLHSGRFLLGDTRGTAPSTAADATGSSSSAESGAAQSVQGTHSSSRAKRMSTTAAPRASASTEGTDGAESQGATAQRPSMPQQAVPVATKGSSAPREQQLPLSARPDAAGGEQRQSAPLRRGSTRFEQPPPAEDSGFQGRSRQLVNLKQRQVGAVAWMCPAYTVPS